MTLDKIADLKPTKRPQDRENSMLTAKLVRNDHYMASLSIHIGVLSKRIRGVHLFCAKMGAYQISLLIVLMCNPYCSGL